MQYVNDRFSQKKALEKRTMRFAVAVLSFIDSIQQEASSRIVGNQLGRSATSVGANYREANRAESKSDFIHKIGIVLKEASETLYWLEILSELKPNDERIADLSAEALEILRIFQASSRKLRQPSNTTDESKNSSTIQSRNSYSNQTIQSKNRRIEKSKNF